jgi:hypothetical protein
MSISPFDGNVLIGSLIRAAEKIFMQKVREQNISPIRPNFTKRADELAALIAKDLLPDDDVLAQILETFPSFAKRDTYVIESLYGDVQSSFSDLQICRHNLEFDIRNHLFDYWYNFFNELRV